MLLERNTKHPNFIIGVLSYILLLVGVVSNSDDFVAGKYLILIAVLFGGIHWVGSIISVWTDPHLKNESDSRYFWLAIVIMIPPIAGMIYYVVKQKKISM